MLKPVEKMSYIPYCKSYK